MGKDDFFVRFGSNADIWANDIEKNLDRVQRRVVTIQRALNGLDKKAIEQLSGTGGGGGGGGRGRAPSLPTGTGPSVESIVEGMAEAASDMKFVAGALKRSLASIDSIPAKLDSSIKRLIDKIGAHGRQAAGQGPDVDPTQPGGRFLPAGQGVPLGSEGELFWRDMRQRFGQVAGQQALITKSSIAGVSQGAIDKAGADRIVKAINKQTDMLKSRLKNLEVRDNRPGGGDDGGPTSSGGRKSAKRSGAAADKGVRQVEVGLADYIGQTDERIARIGAAIDKLSSSGAAVPDELIKNLDAQRKDRAQMAAALRAEERERTGVSQSAQKTAAQKQFREEQKARPVITDEERDARVRRQALAASPLAADFDTRLGRKGKKNGNYSEQDLLDMAETLAQSGVPVKRGRSKQEFGQNLKKGSAEYFALHGPEGDPAYRVDSGAVVKKTTKISKDLASVLGDLTDSVAESAQAWEIVGKDLKSGGSLARKSLRDTTVAAQTEVGQPRTGNIVVPPSMVKGREERGASRQPGDDAEYARARAVIEEGGIAAARAQAARLLRERPDVNIHDPALDAGLQQGSSAGAKGEAITARKRLREMRQYFKEVDAQAEDWHGLNTAMAESRTRQGQLRGTLLAHESVPAGQRTPEHEQEIRRLISDLDQVDSELRNMEIALQRIPGIVRQLAQDPKFQAGATQRKATTIERDAEAATRGERRFTLSDLQLYRSAGGQALGGSRLPGGQSGQTLVKPFAAAVGFSDEKGFYSPNDEFGGKKEKELNQAWTKLTGAIIVRDKLMREGVSEERQVNEALDKVEQAADLFARRFAGVAGGLAPSFEELSGGQRPSSARLRGDDKPTVAEDDESRRARMEQVRRDEARLPTKANRSAVFAYGQDQDASQGTARRLLAAEKRQATVLAKLTKKEEELEAVLALRTPAERAEFAAVEARLQSLRKEQAALGNIALAGGKGGPATGSQLADARTRVQEAQARLVQSQTIGGVDRRTALRSFLGPKAETDQGHALLARVDAEIKGFADALRRAESAIPKAEADYARAVKDEAAAVKEARASIANPSAEGGPLSQVPDARREAEQQRARLLAEEQNLKARREQLLTNPAKAQTGDKDPVAQLRSLYAAREAVIGKVSSAREEGDLKENAGYHAAKDEQGRIEGEIKRLEKALGSGGLVGDFDKLTDQAEKAAGEVKRLKSELEDANKSLTKSASAWEKRKKLLAEERAALVAQGPYKGKDLKRLGESAGQGPEYVAAVGRARRIAEIDREAGVGRSTNQTLVETRALSAAQKTRVAELRQERRELQALPHTRAERKLATLAGDTGAADAIGARRSRIGAIGDELKALGVVRPTRGPGSTGGGGGVTPPSGGVATPGGAGGQLGILRQILVAIKAFHADVKGGKVAPPTGRATAPRTTRTPSTAGELGNLADPTSNDPAILAAARAQQAVQAGKTPKPKPARVPGSTVAAADEAKLRAEIREKERLATAYGHVDAAIIREIEQLRQLTRAAKLAGTEEQRLAAQTAIAAKQLQLYSHINEHMATNGTSSGTARRETSRVLLREADPSVKGKEFDDIAQTARAQRGWVDVGQDWATEAEQGFGGFFGKSGFFKRVIASTGTFIVRNFTAGFVFGLTAAMQQVIDQAIQTEATFVRVSSALQATGKDIGNIRGDLQQISTDYGVQLNDVYETAAGLAGLFDNTEDLAAATRIVAQLQTISAGALNAQEAMGVLASTISAFEALPGQDLNEKLLPGGVEGLQKVADVLTVIQNNLGTNVETTAEGVSRMAGLARQMNLSFEQTAVFTAQIAKQTNQTGGAAGEQFSRILGALQTGRGRGAVTKAYGQPVEAALAQGDYGKVLEEMIKGWDGLSDSQKRNVAISVAGQRQAAAFNALMNNGSKTLNVLAKAEDANGDAAERMDKLMNTLNKRLDVFGTQIQNVASNLVRTGLLNFLGLVLVAGNEVFGAVNDILTLFNKFADENAFLGFLRQAITLLLGAEIAIKAVQYGVGGLKGALARSKMVEGGLGGIGQVADARRARLVAGPARPGWSNYQRQGIVNRSVGFGLDRSVGVGAASTGSGLTSLGTKLRFTTDELGKTTEATGRFRRGLGLALQTAGVGTSTVAGGLRAGFQGRANAGLGSLGFQGRALAYQGEADRLRSQIAGGATSGAGGDARLERAARANERLAGANTYAARSVGRLSDGVNRLGKSGATADVALIGFTLVFASMLDGFRDAAALGKSADTGLDRLIKKARTGEAARQDAREQEYVGPTSDDVAARLDQMRNDSWFDRGKNRFTAATHAALTGDTTSLYTLGINNSSINRDLGIDPNSTYQNPVAYSDPRSKSLAARGKNLLDSFGNTTSGVAVAQKSFSQELAKRAAEIESDDSLSSGQRQAAAAELEQIDKNFSDMAEDLIATASALNQTYALTVEQIKRVNEAASGFSALGGRTSIGDLDLKPLYAELITDTGAESGSKIAKLLDRMSNGTSDSVDQAVLNARLLKAEIKNLYAVWQAKLSQDPDEADDAKQALLGAISSFGQANTQAVQAIIDQANLVNGQLSSIGEVEKGGEAWGKALDRAIRIYDHEAENVTGSMDAIKTHRSAQQKLIEAMQKDMDFASQYGGPEGTTNLGGLLLNPASGLDSLGNPINGKTKKGFQRALNSVTLPTGIDPNSPWVNLPGAGGTPPLTGDAKKAQKAQQRVNDQVIITAMQQRVQTFVEEQTADLRVKSAKTKNPKAKARIDKMIADLTLSILQQVNAGLAPEGSGLSADAAERFGNAAVSNEQVTGALVDQGQQQLAYMQSSHDMALQAAQNANDITQAQIGVRAAIADARGDAVAAAKAQVAAARAALALAKQQLALATTPQEVAAAKVAMLSAQAQLISANAAVSQSMEDLVQSRFQVAIAIAEAAGNSVLAAQRTLAAARQALGAALKKSGGKATSEVNAARVQAIQAEAALRDAKLQDSLDTIDFNLQMGKITQAAAISALKEILRTQDLTKQQRRQLLLQIRGMKNELADSQWNFGNIKMPTPYQMKAYVAARRDQFRNELDAAAAGAGRSTKQLAFGDTGPATAGGSTTTTNIHHTKIIIPGADLREVKRVIREVVGGSSTTITKTTGARRGR